VGIIDTLTTGFDLVRRRPWLIALPVALDIGLWAAPKLSMVSLTRAVVSDLMTAATGVSPDALQGLREQGQMLLEMAESTNVASLIVSSYLGMPSLAVGEMTSFFGRARQVIELQGGLGLVALVGVLLLAGVFLAAGYLGLIAQVVRDGHVTWSSLLAQMPRYWLRLIGAGLIITLALMSFGLPAMLLVALFGSISPSLASLFLGLVVFLALWVFIYMLFVPEAILLGEDNVLKAIWHSALVMRSSFWPALGLLVLSNIIAEGLLYVWQMLAVTASGAVVAIVANAFIGTGLTAAFFVFYRERTRAPEPATEPQRS